MRPRRRLPAASALAGGLAVAGGLLASATAARADCALDLQLVVSDIAEIEGAVPLAENPDVTLGPGVERPPRGAVAGAPGEPLVERTAMAFSGGQPEAGGSTVTAPARDAGEGAAAPSGAGEPAGQGARQDPATSSSEAPAEPTDLVVGATPSGQEVVPDQAALTGGSAEGRVPGPAEETVAAGKNPEEGLIDPPARANGAAEYLAKAKLTARDARASLDKGDMEACEARVGEAQDLLSEARGALVAAATGKPEEAGSGSAGEAGSGSAGPAGAPSQ